MVVAKNRVGCPFGGGDGTGIGVVLPIVLSCPDCPLLVCETLVFFLFLWLVLALGPFTFAFQP